MSDPANQAEPQPARQQFTPFGRVMFVLSIVLLLSGLLGPLIGAKSALVNLADGFGQVDAFAFARHFMDDLPANVQAQSQSSASLMTFVAAGIGALFQAGGECLSQGGWAVLGFIMALTLGILIVWDSMVKESWLWVFAIPIVGGLAAWVLSNVVIEGILWTGILVLQLALIAGSVGTTAPRLADLAAGMLDRFHLAKSIASDASRVYGTGTLAAKLERLERK